MGNQGRIGSLSVEMIDNIAVFLVDCQFDRDDLLRLYELENYLCISSR